MPPCTVFFNSEQGTESLEERTNSIVPSVTSSEPFLNLNYIHTDDSVGTINIVHTSAIFSWSLQNQRTLLKLTGKCSLFQELQQASVFFTTDSPKLKQKIPRKEMSNCNASVVLCIHVLQNQRQCFPCNSYIRTLEHLNLLPMFAYNFYSAHRRSEKSGFWSTLGICQV